MGTKPGKKLLPGQNLGHHNHAGAPDRCQNRPAPGIRMCESAGLRTPPPHQAVCHRAPTRRSNRWSGSQATNNSAASFGWDWNNRHGGGGQVVPAELCLRNTFMIDHPWVPT